MVLQYFTLIHIAISIAGIVSGFGLLAGLVAGRLYPRWADVFLATTITTSVTGFFFPFHGVTPGIVVGVVSLVALAVACYALYVRRLNGVWRRAFVITAVLSLYLNVFVLVVQTFQKNPALVEIAPEQSGPAFAITQAIVLGVFGWLGFIAVRRFRADSAQQN
jgi:hypothetical protein